MQGWPCVGFWNLRFFSPSFSDKNGSLCFKSLCNQYSYAGYLLPFWESGFLKVLNKQGLGGQLPLKKPQKLLGTQSFKSSPSKEFPRCSHNSLLEELSTSRVISLEEDSWKLCLVTPDVTHVPFLFADCTLKTFTVINHRPKYNYMLSSES